MVGLYVSLPFSIALTCDVMTLIDELRNTGVTSRSVNKIKRTVMKDCQQIYIYCHLLKIAVHILEICYRLGDKLMVLSRLNDLIHVKSLIVRNITFLLQILYQ